jgi:hypothetical protein
MAARYARPIPGFAERRVLNAIGYQISAPAQEIKQIPSAIFPIFGPGIIVYYF